MYYNFNFDFINIIIYFLVFLIGVYMRKIFLLIVIVFGVWVFYVNNYGEIFVVDII